MKPGSVLVDIAIDQGGCFEDTHPTTHADPTYQVHDSVFYCVANMPGAVPNTSTYALTNATLPYAVALANQGWRDALRADHALGARPQHPRRPRHERRRSPRPTAWRRSASTRRCPDRPGRQPGHPRHRSRASSATSAGGSTTSAVEKGASDNTLTSYAPRPARATPPSSPAKGIDDAGRVTEADVTDFLASLRERRPRPPRSAGPHPRRGARLPPVPRARGRGGRATRRPTSRPPKPPARLPKAIPLEAVERLLAAASVGDTPGRCATGRCSRCSTAPAPGSARPSASTSTTSRRPTPASPQVARPAGEGPRCGCAARAARSASSRWGATPWRP